MSSRPVSCYGLLVCGHQLNGDLKSIATAGMGSHEIFAVVVSEMQSFWLEKVDRISFAKFAFRSPLTRPGPRILGASILLVDKRFTQCLVTSGLRVETEAMNGTFLRRLWLRLVGSMPTWGSSHDNLGINEYRETSRVLSTKGTHHSKTVSIERSARLQACHRRV